MTGKEYLRSFRDMDAEIDVLIERLKRIKARLEKVTPAYTGMPGGGGTSREDMMAMYMDMHTELNERMAAVQAKQREVMDTIDSIGDPRISAVLHHRYIQHRRFEEIATIMGYAPDHIYRLHRIGCRKITERLKDAETE